MALNPFFLQGSANEQRLVQDLINEQLKIYGVEVVYIPRKFVRKETILKEVSSSKFNDNFIIEAYLNTYDGYVGQGDLLTKFGVSLKDEVSLIISRERFEDFITEFLNPDDPEIELASRPREGDLVYFPLGERLFEVKFVEHEQPFYQLGKLYVYEIKCELFEYEDEILDTTIEEIDTQIQNEGYITTIQLSRTGDTASAYASIGNGYVSKIYLNNDGYGYTKTPTVTLSPSPAGGTNAYAVAITSSYGSLRSIKDILIVNPGSGYTVAPTVTISGGGGVGASATCSIETSVSGITGITMINQGSGYVTKPLIIFTSPDIGTGTTAVGIASISSAGTVETILLSNSGIGYTSQPIVFIESPPISGIDTSSINYQFNEVISGSRSGTSARVKSWDLNTKILKVSLIDDASVKGFYPGEVVTGSNSNTSYIVVSYDSFDNYDKYSENKTIETESEQIVDFSESNPFGTY
jgi:hypothetical protein